MTGPPPPEPEPAPLARRPPRTLGAHWAVDSGVVFLVVVLPALFLDAPLLAIAAGSLVVGIPLAPWTRQLEARALERRPEADAP